MIGAILGVLLTLAAFVNGKSIKAVIKEFHKDTHELLLKWMREQKRGTEKWWQFWQNWVAWRYKQKRGIGKILNLPKVLNLREV